MARDQTARVSAAPATAPVDELVSKTPFVRTTANCSPRGASNLHCCIIIHAGNYRQHDVTVSHVWAECQLLPELQDA